jgi:hypothetical protein
MSQVSHAVLNFPLVVNLSKLGAWDELAYQLNNEGTWVAHGDRGIEVISINRRIEEFYALTLGDSDLGWVDLPYFFLEKEISSTVVRGSVDKFDSSCEIWDVDALKRTASPMNADSHNANLIVTRI